MEVGIISYMDDAEDANERNEEIYKAIMRGGKQGMTFMNAKLDGDVN